MKCPECGKRLRPRWHGLLACFCKWGGRQPSVDQIIASAERYERNGASGTSDMDGKAARAAARSTGVRSVKVTLEKRSMLAEFNLRFRLDPLRKTP